MTQTVVLNESVPENVEVVAAGPQGPQGPQGPKGDVGDVNPQMNTILADAQSARNAAQSARDQAVSAQAAAETAKTSAESAQTAAITARIASETAQTAAETARTGAETAQTSAAASAATATAKAAEAVTSASNAASSATTASMSAATANIKAAETAAGVNSANDYAASALASRNAAASSATSAASSASTASTKATDAANSATAAANSATSAASSAATATSQASLIGTAVTQASNSASAAATSASQAAISASNAASSVTTVQAAATDAQASKVAAQAAAADAQGYRDTAVSGASLATTKANDAAASALAASGSVTSASNAAATATTKASEAAASAAQAAASAVDAAASVASLTADVADAQIAATAAENSAEEAATYAQTIIDTYDAAGDLVSSAAIATAAASEAAQSALIASQYSVASGLDTATKNAQAAASLAQGYAASAASVAQQDLSGVTAQALHRSPNAVTSMFIYDTSKDSDGGAWTEKCQHTSWWNEPLMGKWLGAQTSEINARNAGSMVGNEIVTNGDFSSGTTGWSVYGATLSVVDGVVTVTNNGANYGQVYRTITTVPGTVYRISATVRRGTATEVNLRAETALTAGDLLLLTSTSTTSVTLVGYFRATGTSTIIGCANAVTTNGSGVFDNISVREIIGQAASGDYFQLTTDGKFYRLWKNLISHSENLSNAGWIKSEVTLGSTETSPNGVVLQKVVETTASAAHRLSFSFAFGSLTTTCTISFYAKAAGRSRVILNYINDDQRATFDLAAGTVTSVGYLAGATITSLGNGVYRCVASTTMDGTRTLNLFVDSLTAYAGDGTSGILIGGIMVERGGAVTAYEAKAAEGTISETFRGNKADFPRLAALVAEQYNLTIYDLTEPGRPMWRRFRADGTDRNLMWFNTAPASCVAAINGEVFLGLATTSANYGGALRFQFPADKVVKHWNGSRNTAELSGISTVNEGRIFNPGESAINIANNTAINSVAVTVLSDAPVDPATGLRVPTIWIGTSAGLYVIRQNGSVNLATAPSAQVRDIAILSPTFAQLNAAETNWWIGYATLTATGVSVTVGSGLYVTNELPKLSNSNTGGLKPVGGQKQSMLMSNIDNSALIAVASRPNRAALTRSLAAYIAGRYNTGWMTGDIRRAYLSDVDVGTVLGPELITNGTFDSDISGWTQTQSGGLIEWDAGQLSCRGDTNYNSTAQQVINTTIGRTYKVTFTSDVGGQVFFGTGSMSTNIYFVNAPAGTQTAVFTATSAQVFLHFRGTSNRVRYDNISMREVIADRSYKAASANINGTLSRTQLASGTSLVGYSGFSAANYLREPYSADLDFGMGEWTGSAWVNIPTNVSASAVIFERAAASGASIRFGITATGQLTATAFDGTTTRTVTTSAAYNTAQWLNARVSYTTDGTLSIRINGREVAATRGTPLLTLNNSSAVLTIGNSFAADAPFPGSIALLKLGATVPTYEQSQFMYEQEKQLFRAGAQSVLPDSGSIVDMAYDDATDRWVAVSATNESYWTGLVRNSVTPVPAGSYTRVVAGSGLELVARSTTNPGVDVTIPAYGLREELVKRAEAAARLTKELVTYDYVGGFTANTTNGSTAITNVANLTYPVSPVGARISGSGIPANTTIVAVSGTTIYLSAAATATATGVSISFLDFELPVGMEAKTVISAGAIKLEGATKDYTRLYDGFIETIRFGVAPGATAAVQIQAQRITLQ